MTTKTTRRRVLAGMAGGAVAGAAGTAVAAIPVSADDADFFALYREYRKANAEFEAALDALQRVEKAAWSASPDPLRQEALDRAHAAEQRTCDRDWELFMRVGAAPVHTLEGVRVKLQALATWLHDDRAEIETPFVDTALEAVERLAAGGAA